MIKRKLLDHMQERLIKKFIKKRTKNIEKNKEMLKVHKDNYEYKNKYINDHIRLNMDVIDFISECAMRGDHNHKNKNCSEFKEHKHNWL